MYHPLAFACFLNRIGQRMDNNLISLHFGWPCSVTIVDEEGGGRLGMKGKTMRRGEGRETTRLGVPCTRRSGQCCFHIVAIAVVVVSFEKCECGDHVKFTRAFCSCSLLLCFPANTYRIVLMLTFP